MTITDHIVQYAAQRRGVFRKKDLSAWFDSMGIPVGKGLQTQLNRLVASNRLTKTGWGEYQIGANTKPRLQLTLKPGTEEVGLYLQNRYPLAEFCIWDAASVIPFMLHVPNIKMTIIDVERILEQSFPDALREEFPNTIILPNPTQDEFFKFGNAQSCIVLHTLTTEAPLDSFKGINVPTAEKMLVDITLNPEFEFLHGSELPHIYREVFSDFNISRNKLLRYARRRYCEKNIQHLLDRITIQDYDRSRKQKPGMD
jgi:hypothetical protein